MSRRVFKAVLVSALCCVFAGCIVPEPRTGNLFLSTRQNFGWLTRQGEGGGLAGGTSIVLGPLFLIGTFTTAPIYDVLCFPYDCYLKFSGTKFIFLDDEMQPIEKCNVSFYSDALPDESPSCSRSSRQGCYSPGVHVERIGRWSLSATKEGYYPITIDPKDLAQSAQDQIHTGRLYRVINPIPLYVNAASGEYRGRSRAYYELSIKKRDFSVTNGVPVVTNEKLSYDLIKGAWLPPHGDGETCDIQFVFNENVLGWKEDKGYDGTFVMKLYRTTAAISMPGRGNGIVEMPSRDNAGIKLRIAPVDGFGNSLTRWRGWFGGGDGTKTDSDKNRCYAFRIRTEYDENGKIKSAYYGKIYNDFDISSLEGVRFLYYLNPKSNDRNLEWDMQSNLCPKPGDIGHSRP